MRAASSGKRLFDPVLLQKLCESGGCVPLPSITMKYQIFGLASFLISISKCGGNQMRTGVTRHSVTHDPSGIEIQNNTEIYPIVVDPKVCNITDSYLVWTLRSEFSCEQIALCILLPLFVLLFRI